MIPTSAGLRRGLADLAETFRTIKERVRDAVAVEMARAVASAVRDGIAALFRGRPSPAPRDSYGYAPHRSDDGWDEEDRWDDGDRWNEPERRDDPPPVPEDTASAPRVSRWAAALSIGCAVARWLIVRRVPALPAVGVAALAAAAGLAGGPLLHASLAVAASATDLVRWAAGAPDG